MQGIEFEENNDLQDLDKSTLTKVKSSFMVNMLKKAGVRDTATANFILIVIAVIFFGLTIYMYASILGEKIPSRGDMQKLTAGLNEEQTAK